MKIVNIVTVSLSLLLAFIGDNVSQAADSVAEPVEQVPFTIANAPAVGAWSVNKGNFSPKKNKEAMKAFKLATNNRVGYDYKVISVLGAQVVAGMNYSYLCQGKALNSQGHVKYLIVNVYQDLTGKAAITGTRELIPEASEQVPGGWSYNEGKAELQKNPDVKEAFNTALKGFVGADIEPIAFVASQALAGMNYAILASVAPVYPNAPSNLALILIHTDFEGHASLVTAKYVGTGIH